jgi:hypothetical protein
MRGDEPVQLSRYSDGLRGLIPGKSKKSFSSPQRPDPPCNSFSLLSNGRRGKSDGGMKLTTHLHLVPRIVKNDGTIPQLPHTSSWVGLN